MCAWVCVPCCVASVGWRAARACIRPRALPHTTVPASAARCSEGCVAGAGPSAGLVDPRATRSIQRQQRQRVRSALQVPAMGQPRRCRVSRAYRHSRRLGGEIQPSCRVRQPYCSIGRPIEHRSTKSTPHIIAALLRHGCVAIRFRLARHAETAGVRASRAVIQSVIDTCLGGGSADALGYPAGPSRRTAAVESAHSGAVAAGTYACQWGSRAKRTSSLTCDRRWRRLAWSCTE